jgi:hypothetical protein
MVWESEARYGRIILKWIAKKWVGKLWTRFISLRMVPEARSCEQRNETSGLIIERGIYQAAE